MKRLLLAAWAASSTVLAACSGAIEPASNRATHVSCDVPHVLLLSARRYANLDHDDPDFDKWTPWTLSLELDADVPIMKNDHGHVRHVRGTARLVGDRLHLDYTFGGAVACEAHRMKLSFDSHEPVNAELDLAAHTGIVTSIDDRWLIGPPFPPHPP